MATLLFGHQGGWDEALMVLVPIGLFVGLLWLATRRAKAIQAKRSQVPQSLDTLKAPDPETNRDPS